MSLFVSDSNPLSLVQIWALSPLHQAAQEREELRQRADLLDAKIHQTQQENRALQNTEQLISDSNAAFRRSLNPAEDPSES